MPEEFTGLVEFKNDVGETVVLVDPNEGVIEFFMSGGFTSFGLDDLVARALTVDRQVRVGQVGVGSPPALFEVTNPKVAGGTVLKFDAGFAVLDIGGQHNEGDLRVRDDDNHVRIHLDAGQGRLTMTDSSDRLVLRFQSDSADLDIGAVLGSGSAGDVRVRDATGKVRIHLDGTAGQVRTFGADCAEDFPIDSDDPLDPGTVAVLCEDETLRRSDRSYDSRVVGIVSGAGGLSPGIVLGRDTEAVDRVPLAVAGKAWCKVDASHGPIALGDLLTTSATPGHAMRVHDSAQALGAIVGKSLRPWADGTGMVPVLVSLQ